MARESVILVFTQQVDAHADPVIQELTRRGHPVVRFDTADFPQRASVCAESTEDGWEGGIALRNGKLVPFGEVRSIWYRRPTAFEFPPDLAPANREFAIREAIMAFGGLLRSERCLWVNHPEKLVIAEHKAFQLAEANRCGVSTPRTLITNRATDARRFFDSCGGNVIYKALSPALVFSSESPGYIYTTPVERSDLEDERRIQLTACMFQERVDKECELRITVIGEHVFTARIDADAPVLDWRLHYDEVRHSPFELPESLCEKLKLLVRGMGLHFAAIDMILTHDGRYVFLELNPGGQWMWIQHETGLPLVAAMADLLASGRAVSATPRATSLVV